MKKSELAFTAILVPLDFVLVFLAAQTAYSLRFGPLEELRPTLFEFAYTEYLLFSAGVTLIFIFFFALSGLYGVAGARKLKMELSRIFLACSTAIMTVIAVFFFRSELFNSRFIVLAAWFFAVLYVSGGRIVIRLLQRLLLRFGAGTHRVVMVGGDDKTTKALIEAFAKFPGLGYKVVRRVPRLDEKARQEIEELIDTTGVDDLIASTTDMDREELTRVLGFAQSHHLAFKYSADLLATRSRNIDFGEFAGIPLVEIKGTRLDGWGRIFKRIFDVIVSMILIIITSPIMIITAIAIKLDSKGPVFFSRLDDRTPVTRVGEHGREFRYFKFRSMKPGTHRMRYEELKDQDTRKGGPLVKIKDDPRITRVGKLIRRFSIDELPELFLVLFGKMSLVGPRPHLPEEVAKYQETHRKVLTIKPGITGMAQVSGRADLDFDDEVNLDTYYIENWSPWMDLAILFKTPFVVIRRKGAY